MEDISSDYAEKIVRDWVRDAKKPTVFCGRSTSSF